MAKSKLATIQVVGIALVVLGVGLAFWGYQQSGSLGSQISETISGSPTDKVMTLYISGAVAFVVGIFLYIKK